MVTRDPLPVPPHSPRVPAAPALFQPRRRLVPWPDMRAPAGHPAKSCGQPCQFDGMSGSMRSPVRCVDKLFSVRTQFAFSPENTVSNHSGVVPEVRFQHDGGNPRRHCIILQAVAIDDANYPGASCRNKDAQSMVERRRD